MELTHWTPQIKSVYQRITIALLRKKTKNWLPPSSRISCSSKRRLPFGGAEISEAKHFGDAELLQTHHEDIFLKTRRFLRLSSQGWSRYSRPSHTTLWALYELYRRCFWRFNIESWPLSRSYAANADQTNNQVHHESHSPAAPDGSRLWTFEFESGPGYVTFVIIVKA